MCTSVKKEGSVERKHKTSMIFQGMASNMLKHFFICMRSYFNMFIDFIFSLFLDGTRKAIPDLKEDNRMLAESAVVLARKIRNKELKSEHLVKAFIERIKEVNPIINAMTDQRFEAALKEATEVDNMIGAGVQEEYFEKKPFLGVPFTTKESHSVEGLLKTLGILSRKNKRSTDDAEGVRLLKEAGAIAIAVSNVPEINKWQETRNNVYGQTNNPYHTGHTVGGSSGGEAALMAAMATPIALCSDIGGSTRMPAFYCGLFGHNPTCGTTNLRGLSLRTGEDDTMASIGFVSRHCEDLAPLTKVIAGDKAALLQLDRPVDVKKIKFYYLETGTDLRVSPICGELRKIMTDVVSRVSAQCTSTELAPQRLAHGGFAHMFALWKHHMTLEAETFARLLTDCKGEARGVAELAKYLIGQSEFTLAAIIKLLDDQVLPAVPAQWALETSELMKKELTETLMDDAVLLVPSAPLPAPYHGSAFLRPFDFAYWAIFNVLRFPATQVPLGLSSEGLPLGIQVVASPYNDALCLAVAKYLEQEFGGFVPPCKV